MKAQSGYQISAARIGPLSATNAVIIRLWLVLRFASLEGINIDPQPSTFNLQHIVVAIWFAF